MGEKHKVRFEPVDIEIEVDEDETVLEAAFKHGVMLMHGCKEGQCSACKSFLLDGDLEMNFLPGQYAELFIPGTEEHRAYSMANTPSSDERAEFIIRVYPGGRFSGLLGDEVEDGIKVGDSMKVRVPFGMFTMREKSEGDIIFVGGGSGMAPILSLIRHMAEKGIERNATFYYGARTRKDLFYLDEIQELGEQMSGEFRFVPALSEPEDDDEWDGETGLVTDVVQSLEDDLNGTEAYIAGPSPMSDAAIPVLMRMGVDEDDIYYDKFTITAETEEGAEQGEEGKGHGVE